MNPDGINGYDEVNLLLGCGCAVISIVIAVVISAVIILIRT